MNRGVAAAATVQCFVLHQPIRIESLLLGPVPP